MRARLAAMIVLLPALAFAGWKSVGVRGPLVNDLEMVDAGQVLASSSGAGGAVWWAQLEADGGVTTVQQMSGQFIGGFAFGSNCVVGQLNGGGMVYVDAGCGTDFLPTSSPRGFRGFGSNGLAFIQVSPLESLLIGSTTSTSTTLFGGTWAPPPTPYVRALHFGDADLIGLSVGLGPGSLKLSVDGGAPLATTWPGGPYADFSLFERSGRPQMAAISAGNVILFSDVRVPTSSPTSFDGGTPTAISIGGDQGMLITSAGGIASPIPDPMNPLATWKLRKNVSLTLGSSSRVSCLPSTRWCAVTETSGTVWMYENANAPTVQVPATIVTDAGTVRVVLDAGDLDDDILFHSWAVGGSAIAAVVPGVDDGVAMDVSFPTTSCLTVPVIVTTTDGLNSLMTPFNINFVMRGTPQIAAPMTNPFAGGGPQTFTAFLDAGCEPATFSWMSSSGQTQTGPAFDYQPPATSCGTSETITLTTTWQSGMPATTMTTTQVTPTPWGAPSAPTFPMPAMQQANSSQVWPATLAHACDMTGGFPGLELIWDPFDGGGVVTATPVDGGLQVDAAQSCLGTQFVATARAQVVGETLGRVSLPGTLVVDIAPGYARFDSTANYGLNAFADSGVAYGDTTIQGACLAQRALKSEISVLDGTTIVASARFTTPGPFSVTVPGSCAGGMRELVARLYEDDIDTGAEQRAQLFFDPTPVAVGAQVPAQLTARCGEGVRGQLSLEPVPNTCMAVESSWRQLEGSPLLTTSGVGVIDVQTAALDLSMAGEQLTFEWTVDGGAGNSATDQRTVSIGVEPFVTVSVRTLPLQRREESAFDVEVVLTNTTACAVDSLDVTIPVSGGAALPNTLLVDGSRFSSSVEGGALEASGISLPASGHVVLRFSAAPQLVGSPRFTPDVTLRGLSVGIAATPGAQPSGCGCTTAPFAALWVLSLFALGRRRRRE